MFRRHKIRKNLLEMKPLLKEQYKLEPRDSAESGFPLYELVIPRDSWLERLSVRYLGQPETIKVKLDRLGSYVLSHCRGELTVEEISDKLSETFGEEAEPVLPRLVKYLEIVETNGWIRMIPDPS
ncbi:coenzyme PQQ synthesis protein D (PqqD) [Melghirimyces profundicolus]|uniref:Coenzyme PQQ synthesis protein D (PqqD) n=1 Tax=Melghirimyces profundicolus TaxID=1242148 RepID=A0A2T6BSQ9_9BACL|nr:PqqD family protein [Melghirimyces profundicolus]PTX59118.1 coenzyme PQQ synthesis protein D (PqqD) [Melghirimyces profundicolus]